MIKPEYENIPDTEFVPLREGIDSVFWGKYKINKLGEIWSIKYKKKLSQTFDDRYYKCHLSTKSKDGIRHSQTYRVHRLVASQFLVNSDPILNTVVDHINRDRKLNCATNLRWTTPMINNNNRSKKKTPNLTVTRMYYKIDDQGTIIEKIKISDQRKKDHHYSEKIVKAIRENQKLDGYFWRCVTLPADEVYTKYGYNPIWKESISLPGVFLSNLGTIKRGVVETLGSNRRGYYVAMFNSQGKAYSMNRLIAETFIVERLLEKDEVVDHLNTLRLDNRVKNLRVCSQKENMNNPITRQKFLKEKADNNPQ